MSKLYRSLSDKMVTGVAGGLGQYLMIDPTWVRLGFILLTVLNGAGFWIYLVMSLVVPQVPAGEEIIPSEQSLFDNPDFIKIAGGSLVIFGLFSLLGNFNFPWMLWLSFSNLWPVLLIIVGLFLLVRTFRKEE